MALLASAAWAREGGLDAEGGAAGGVGPIVPVVFGPGELVSDAFLDANSAVGCDLDGDGDVDVVSSWVLGNVIAWHENLDGGGTAWGLHEITSGVSGSRYAAVADVDGDGDLDVLSASCMDDKVAWYQNVAGDGTVWKEIVITTDADCAQYVTAEDLDEDGDLDVLVVSYLDAKVAWHENVPGDGTAWIEHVIGTERNGGREVVACDLDGDGDPDVVAAWSESKKVAWYENVEGDASAWGQVVVTQSAPGAVAVAPGDLDGDGDLDLAVASFVDGVVAWHENAAGDGSSWVAHAIDSGAVEAGSVAVGDLDRDGDLDVVAAVFGRDEVAWYENSDGDGSSWRRWLVSDAANGARRVRLADVDSDGDLDVLAALYSSSEVVLYRNLQPRAEAVAYSAPASIGAKLGGPGAVVAVDLDRDGDLDAVATSEEAGSVRWHENVAGDASAWSTWVVSDSSPGPRDVLAADLDDDGDPDLAVAALGGVAWHENRLAEGAVWDVHAISEGPGGALDARHLASADLDGDGDLDVLAAAGDGLAWYANASGDGSVWTPFAIDWGAGGARAAVAADVDGDGDLDAVSAAALQGRLLWHENLAGDGSSWAQHVVSTGLVATAVAAADVDRDGDLDLFSATAGGDVLWHENADGAGTAWKHALLAAGASAVRSVEAADLDRDGDVDVLLATVAGAAVAWLENVAGDGSDWKAHVAPVGVPSASAATAADVDGDGFPDLLLATEAGGLALWAHGRASAPAATSVLACAGNPEGSLVVLAGEPALGATLVLGVGDPSGAAPPGSSVLVAYSRAPAAAFDSPCGHSLPEAGLGSEPGVLQVSLAPDALLEILGGATWTGQPVPVAATVPVKADLVEAVFYAQGALVDPASGAVGLTEAVRIVVGP